MAITDRREPGVYVSIEDLSYVASTPNTGRAVYCVGVCQKGPHNRIVQVTSQAEFHQTFGQPNFYKTSKSHYIMDKAMQYSGRGYYVRLTPDDAKQANVLISKTDSTESNLSTLITGVFSWAESDEVVCTTDVSSDLSVGDWIYSETETDSGYIYAKQIIALEVESDSTTTITLDSNYAGTTGDAAAFLFTPYETTTPGYDATLALPTETADLNTNDVYGFYATGAGAAYNNYKIKGNRNVELEKMFVDDDGIAEYKYLFMDIGVYEVNDITGAEALVEGPWRVSLIDNTPDGIRIRDLSSGQPLYIESVINNNSKLIHCCVGAAMQDLRNSSALDKSTEYRKQVMMLLSAGQPPATSFTVVDPGVSLASGFDGTTDGIGGDSLYDDTTGFINIDENIEGLATQAYNCSMTGIDGSIAQMREVTYPVYQPDYILTGEWPAATQNGGRQLADLRQDCIHLGDSTYQTSYSNDLDARLNLVPWNNWTSALYCQFRRRRDEYTGQYMVVSPVFHAIENHLAVDGNYFLGEPVAGIEKGAIAEPIELVYTANHTERGDLGDAELNLTIVEPEGKYFLTQFTTWKRLSILKRLHAAKFVAFVRKSVPPLLKDLLQRKGTDFWVKQGQSRVDYFLSKYMGSNVEALNMLTNYSVNVEFDEVASELNVYIGLTPVRVIERINVYIAVS